MTIKQVLVLFLFTVGTLSLMFSLRVPAGAETPTLANQLGVPKEMTAAIQPISNEEEIELGREVAANLLAQFGLYENEGLSDYVSLVGLTVVEACPRKDIPYHFGILNTEVVNAFAAPGGYIFITKGLYRILKDEAQLATVLAHEVAHVTQRHVIKEIQKSRIAQAAIPSYVKASAQKAEWMKQVTDMAVQMIWKGLSREDELESDRMGLEYARAAGYEAQSFDEVLSLLKARSQDSSKTKELKFLLSTHPKPEDRLTAVSEKIKGLPAGGERLQERFAKNTPGQ